MLGLPFVCQPAADVGPFYRRLPPQQAVAVIARDKARQVSRRFPDDFVLGADTVVMAPDGQPLGKPLHSDDARRMLSLLSGRTHCVLTAVHLFAPGQDDGFVSETRVTFLPLDTADIEAYIATGEPSDKAGAYAIQGFGMRFVEKIEGDFYAVMGLPGARLRVFLKEKGFFSV